MARFRVHDESLNSYGFWILTEGGNLEDFKKNPICLYNHTFAWTDKNDVILPIGIWENIGLGANGEIQMDVVFDEDDDFALKIKKKVDKKMLRATSIGITILEWSEDAKYLKAGQTRPTVTKWKLREVSICDVPSNKNAVMLNDSSMQLFDVEGNIINLNEKSGDVLLPLLNKQPNIENTMELKDIAKSLNLPETASLSDVSLRVSAVQSENVALKSENDQYKEAETVRVNAAVETVLNDAVAAKKINETQKATFRALLKADFENGNAALQAMNTQVSLSGVPDGGTQGKGGMVRNEKGVLQLDGKTYSELTKSDKGTEILKQLRETDNKAFLEFQKG